MAIDWAKAYQELNKQLAAAKVPGIGHGITAQTAPSYTAPSKPTNNSTTLTNTSPSTPAAPATTYNDWDSGSNSYNAYLKKAEKEAKKAAEARMNAQISTIAGQQSGINQTAEEAARQAYINRELTLRGLPQQNAALGISGGGAESALLGLNTGYENSRNSIFQARDNALQENVNQQNQIRMAGDATTSDISNAYAQRLAEYLQQQQTYQQQRADQLSDLESQRAYQMQQAQTGSATAAANAQRGGKNYKYTSDPDFIAQVAEVDSGVVPLNSLIANAAYLMQTFGYDAYNELVKRAQAAAQRNPTTTSTQPAFQPGTGTSWLG